MMPAALCAVLLVSAATAPDADAVTRLAADPSLARALTLVEQGDVDVIERGLAEPRTRQLVAWALVRHVVPELRETLESLVASPDQTTGYFAATALGRLGDRRSIPVLVDLLPKATDDYWEYVRRSKLRAGCAAVEALGRIGGPEAESVLLHVLSSGRHLLRYGAVRGLAAMGEPARPHLERVARTDHTLFVRLAAQRALVDLDQRTKKGRDREALPRPALDRLRHVPAIAFIRKTHRSHADFGFREWYSLSGTSTYASGDNIYTLTPPGPDGTLRNLTNLTDGAVQGLEVSPDGKRLLFAMRRDADTDGFHIYEMNVDGTHLRRITHGDCNDVDPAYLPDGRIAFCSDRDGTREFHLQERARTLYVVGADGSDPRQVSFNPNQDYEPLVLRDGSIAYASYRFYGQDGSGSVYSRRGSGSGIARIETHLRTIRPDATGDRHLYGTRRGLFYLPVFVRMRPDSIEPQIPYLEPERERLGVVVAHHRQMPDGRLICVTPAGLTLVDLTRHPLDCEIPVFPEAIAVAEGLDSRNPVGWYTTPYPVDDDTILVSRAPFYSRTANGYGICLVDPDSRKHTIVYDDPDSAEVGAVPLVASTAPPRGRGSETRRASAPTANAGGNETPETGEIFVYSVFQSDLKFNRKAVRYLRVAVAEQVGLSMNANSGFRSRVIGTIPIEPDGSVRVEVPANTPLHLALLDIDENVLIRETAFNVVGPGEVLSCVGCHESMALAPPPSARRPLALANAPHRAHHQRNDLIFMGRPERSYSVLTRR